MPRKGVGRRVRRREPRPHEGDLQLPQVPGRSPRRRLGSQASQRANLEQLRAEDEELRRPSNYPSRIRAVARPGPPTTRSSPRRPAPPPQPLPAPPFSSSSSSNHLPNLPRPLLIPAKPAQRPTQPNQSTARRAATRLPVHPAYVPCTTSLPPSLVSSPSPAAKSFVSWTASTSTGGG